MAAAAHYNAAFARNSWSAADGGSHRSTTPPPERPRTSLEVPAHTRRSPSGLLSPPPLPPPPWSSNNVAVGVYQTIGGRPSPGLPSTVVWSPSTIAEEDKREKRRRRRQRVVNCCKRIIAFLFSHIGLAGMVVAYSILGGFLFRALEAPHELEVKEAFGKFKTQKISQISRLHETLPVTGDNFTAQVRRILGEFQRKIVDEVKLKGWDGKNDDDEEKLQWSFAGALLYAVTVVTTIGYGHIAPKTTWGRMLTIVYALIGIPLTFLYLSNIGNFLADCFRLFYKRICCDVCCCQQCERKRKRQKLKLRQRREIAAQLNVAMSSVGTSGGGATVAHWAIAPPSSSSSGPRSGVDGLAGTTIVVSPRRRPDVARRRRDVTSVSGSSGGAAPEASTSSPSVPRATAAPSTRIAASTSKSTSGSGNAYANVRETAILDDDDTMSASTEEEEVETSNSAAQSRNRLLSEFLKSKETDITHDTAASHVCLSVDEFQTETETKDRGRKIQRQTVKPPPRTTDKLPVALPDPPSACPSNDAGSSRSADDPSSEVPSKKSDNSKPKLKVKPVKENAHSGKKAKASDKPRRRFFRVGKKTPTAAAKSEDDKRQRISNASGSTLTLQVCRERGQPPTQSTLHLPQVGQTGNGSATPPSNRRLLVVDIDELIRSSRSRYASGPEDARTGTKTRRRVMRSYSSAKRPETVPVGRKLKRNATFGAGDTVKTVGVGAAVGTVGAAQSVLLRKVRQQLTPNLAASRRRLFVGRGSLETTDSFNGGRRRTTGSAVDPLLGDSSESFVTAHGESVLNLSDVDVEVGGGGGRRRASSAAKADAGLRCFSSSRRSSTDDDGVDGGGGADAGDGGNRSRQQPAPTQTGNGKKYRRRSSTARTSADPIVDDYDDDDDDDDDADADLMIFAGNEDGFDDDVPHRGDDTKVSVPISICLVIIAVYIVAGSALFAIWEGWDYLTGSYFCFITLSTIGFGDFVPGTDVDQWASHEKLVLCALWLAFGLSLLAMCFNLMQEEVKEKCKWIGRKLGLLKNEGAR